MTAAATAGKTIGEVLRAAAARLRAAGVETARLDAEVLLADRLGVERWRLVADAGETLSREVLKAFEAALGRREAREPVAYIVGRKEFWSLDLAVTPAVLIPRPETECLVETAIRWLRQRMAVVHGSRFTVHGSAPPPTPDPRPPVVVDLGTGPGTIVLAVASEVAGPRYVGTDLSAEAVALARRNAQALGLAGRVTFVEGDLFDPLGALGLEGGVDLLLANPPYVSEPDLVRLAPEIRRYEPRLALCGGADGLDVIRRLVGEAPRWLAPGGALLFEFGDGQAAACQALVRAAGPFGPARIVRDLGGYPRALLASLRVAGFRAPGSGLPAHHGLPTNPEPATRNLRPPSGGNPQPASGSEPRRG